MPLDQIEPFDTNWINADLARRRNEQQDFERQGYANAANSLTNEDYPGAVNALVRIGQPGQAALVKNTWQSPAENAELNTNVGNALARGNWQEAEKIALRDGNLDVANSVRNRQNQITNQSLVDSNRAVEKTANLLEALKADPTPEKWAMVRQAALASGRYSPQDIAKIDAMIQQNGIGATADFYHRQVLGAQGQLQEIQKQREPITSGLGELAADQKISDEDWQKYASAYAAAHNNPDWLKPYLTSEGRRLALAESGKTIETQGTKGGRRLAVDFGTQRVVDQFIEEHPEWKGREKEIEGLAQSAFGNKTFLELGPNGKPRLALEPGTMAYNRSPEGVMEIAEGRKGGTLNAAQTAQLNRIPAQLAQLEELRKYARAAEAKDALGLVGQNMNSRLYSELHGSEVPTWQKNVASLTSALGEELNQYLSVGGQTSDTRLKQANEIIGDLPRSKDPKMMMSQIERAAKLLSSFKENPPLTMGQIRARKAEAPAQAGHLQGQIEGATTKALRPATAEEKAWADEQISKGSSEQYVTDYLATKGIRY